MAPQKSVTPSPSTTKAIAAAAAADTVLILVFAAVGRGAHERGDIITGVLLTAWPFLAGAAAAWLVLRLWRAPLTLWPAGVGVWLGSVVVGMLLRAMTAQTVVVPFVIVALVSLGVLLVGYRALVAAARRAARARGTSSRTRAGN